MTGIFESLKFSPNHPLFYNSVLFFALFTLFYGVYILAFNKVGLRNLLLVIFSLYFYFKVSGLFVIILLLISTSDYFIGLWIYYTKSNIIKKTLVTLSLLIDLGYLAYYKYFDFLLQTFGIDNKFTNPFISNILVPIGISYFVFKTLTYIFDIYRERIAQPEHNYINYVLYISFFPNILAGPISKARDLLPQIKNKLTITEEHIGRGFFLILAGAFKKIFVADYLANNFVDRVFDTPTLFTGFENLMATYSATIQIYFDFSGYTDMVIGIALLMGFTIQPNFNKPFLAQNVSEFWRRWHITLSQWMNEYLFYQFSFSLRRLKIIGVIIAVLLTFIISGIWHGPNWTFILWGCLHGLAVVYDVITKGIRLKISKVIPSYIYRFFSILITLNFLCFTIVFFRASDLTKAMQMYEAIFTHFDISVAREWVLLYTYPFAMMLFAYLLHYLPQKWNDSLTMRYIKLHWILKAIIAFIAVLIIYQAFNTDTQPFIYLEF